MKKKGKITVCLVCRYVLYTFLLFILYWSLTFQILPKNWSFAENGIIEWLQFSLLLLLAGIFASIALIDLRTRKIHLLLFSCVLLALARELDKVLDECIPLLGWQAVFLLAVPLVLWQFRNWRETLRQLQAFLFSPAMGIFWAAVIVILPLAQCIGDGEYLRAAMGEEYVRKYKTLFEESLELYGYVLLLCGAVESVFFARQYQSVEPSDR